MNGFYGRQACIVRLKRDDIKACHGIGVFFLEGNNSDDASKAAFNLGTSVSWWRTLSLFGWELEEIRVETIVTHVGGPSMGTAAQT